MSFTEEEEKRLFAQLETALGATLRAALVDQSVVEICLNEDGLVRVERLGQGFEVTRERFAPARANTLLKVIATLQDAVLNARSPVLETYIPGYGARIEGVIAPNSSRAPIFAIRRPTTRVLTLAHYLEEGRMSAAVAHALTEAVRGKKKMLVVGGTGSGKTTLINALMQEIAAAFPQRRLVILEDTRELVAPSSWCVQLETSRGVDLDELLRVTLRLRPDGIVVGEVRGPEAGALLRAWNTGHDGGIASVHADSAALGLLRIEQLASLRGAASALRQEIVAALQVVVFVERGPAGPRVCNVLAVDGVDGERYLTRELAA